MQNHQMTIKGAMTSTFTTDNPTKEIRKILQQYKSPRFDFLPTFTGGLVGYFAYEYIRYSEPKLDFKDVEDISFNDVDLMLFDKVIAFDHYKKKKILVKNPFKTVVGSFIFQRRVHGNANFAFHRKCVQLFVGRLHGKVGCAVNLHHCALFNKTQNVLYLSKL